ncbi:hypothetical protein NPIL_60871 [Nephila pilipes]|uniref:Uncharacterized protein n=1 Tax=Nephila pilipes TaxID=299642 RepID=A0A8X6J0N8_NEPPI|nr:hypothetical protein NPIL_60871 [Nephila pilipes]
MYSFSWWGLTITFGAERSKECGGLRRGFGGCARPMYQDYNYMAKRWCENDFKLSTRKRLTLYYRKQSHSPGEKRPTPVRVLGRGLPGQISPGIRLLYYFEVIETLQDCRDLLESIFYDTWATPRVRDMYVECAQGEVADIAEWLWEQQDKTKKKKVEEGNNKDEQSAPKVVVTE